MKLLFLGFLAAMLMSAKSFAQTTYDVQLTCSSWSTLPAACQISQFSNVQVIQYYLAREYSNNKCYTGSSQNFYISSNTLNVYNGCRGLFYIRYQAWNQPPPPPPGGCYISQQSNGGGLEYVVFDPRGFEIGRSLSLARATEIKEQAERQGRCGGSGNNPNPSSCYYDLNSYCYQIGANTIGSCESWSSNKCNSQSGNFGYVNNVKDITNFCIRYGAGTVNNCLEWSSNVSANKSSGFGNCVVGYSDSCVRQGQQVNNCLNYYSQNICY
jgi:hypothetical protein